MEANPAVACVGDTITFTAGGVVDSGGIRRLDCVGKTFVAPVAPSYTWTLTLPPDYPPPLPPLSGSGSSVSVVAKVAGTYSASFMATADRDCAPPEITLGPASKAVAAPMATLTLSPSSIPASTAWPGAAWNFSDISVTWSPPECEGILKIVELVGNNGHTPPDPGTLAPLDATTWRYTAFDEPKTEKHPERVVVWIAAMQGTQELTRVQVVVRPVFKWWVTGHKHGPAGIMHSPNVDDYRHAYEYIVWKYAQCVITAGGSFRTVDFVLTQLLTCRGKSAVACTTILDSVTFATAAFDQGENVAASIIGHELTHTVGALNQSECTAYTWEVANQPCTWISGPYWVNVQQMQAEECAP